MRASPCCFLLRTLIDMIELTLHSHYRLSILNAGHHHSSWATHVTQLLYGCVAWERLGPEKEEHSERLHLHDRCQNFPWRSEADM